MLSGGTILEGTFIERKSGGKVLEGEKGIYVISK